MGSDRVCTPENKGNSIMRVRNTKSARYAAAAMMWFGVGELCGADRQFDDGLDAFLSSLGDGHFPLSRTKAQEMRDEFSAHGFASFF